MKKTLADYWAPRINAQWQKSVEGIIGVGRQLIAAKEACEHGEFMRLFKGSDNAVPSPVPFTLNTAERLMRVARHPVLSNSAHVQTLPQSWGTVYELSQLDDDTLTAGIKAGEITPEMTRSQAAKLHADPIERLDREVCVLAWEAMSSAYARFAQRMSESDKAFLSERLACLLRLIEQEQGNVA